jgi:hypothetical protein
MKKNILNEVNKIREMMGLINEQNEQETGCIDGDCEDGTGTYVYDNGNKYEGKWVDGQRHGTGTFVYTNGDRYYGDWENDIKNGTGTYTWPSGTEYKGEWVDGLRKGTGTQIWSNGDEYSGDWKDDKRHGYGTYTYGRSGGKYEGEWEKDNQNGTGTYTWYDGDKYKGEWKNGNKDGFGTLFCKDGTEHEQRWEDGKLISGGSCDENSNNNTGSQGNNTFPENWKEGINNKGWVIMKGSHGHEGKIPDTKKAIEFIQTKVGLSGDDVDGLYGSNTAKKVWNYQENNGLKPDGKVGKNTLAKMLS